MTTHAFPTKKTYTLGDVAEISGLTKRSLEDACRAGRIWHYHFGRQRTFSEEQLDAFLKSIERPAEPRPRSKPHGEAAEAARVETHRARVADRLARKAGAA